MFISQTTYSEDSIYKRRNYNLKLKSSFKKVKRIIPEKTTIAVQWRHKKRCTNCQDHEEMKLLLKQKLKEQLQTTRQTERNKESQTLVLEAIGEFCRHGRTIYHSSKQDGENGIVINSQKINFHSSSFQIAVYLTLFVIVFNKVFKKVYLLCFYCQQLFTVACFNRSLLSYFKLFMQKYVKVLPWVFPVELICIQL